MQGFIRPHADEPSEQQTIESDSIRTVTTRTGENAEKPIPAPSSNSCGPLNRSLSDQDLDRVQKLQSGDPNLTPIISALAEGGLPLHSEAVALSPAVRYYWSIWNSLSLRNGWLYRTFYRRDATSCHLQFIVPKVLRTEIFGQMHNFLISGYLRRKKTLGKSLQMFYLLNVREDVHMWIIKCDICASIKSPVRKPWAPLGKMQAVVQFRPIS